MTTLWQAAEVLCGDEGSAKGESVDGLHVDGGDADGTVE